MTQRLYPDSKVEVRGFEARHYDRLMDLVSLGTYPGFLRKVFERMDLQPGQRVLDLGAGTGRNTEMIANRIGPDGEVWGVELGDEMARNFEKRCGQRENCHLVRGRIDQPLDLKPGFDKAFISFVLHGLPHEHRLQVLENVRRLLKPGGWFVVLDYKQQSRIGALRRFMFTRVECPYSLDYIRRDWYSILSDYDLVVQREGLFFFGIISLLQAQKRE